MLQMCLVIFAYIHIMFVTMYIDPSIAVEVIATNIPAIYQPLVLQCNATIEGGITSTVDIIWTTEDTLVRRVNNITASSNINSTSIYNDSFIIPSLNISDIGYVYQCEVLINSIIPTTAKADFIIPIPGMPRIYLIKGICMYVATYVHMYIHL